MTIAGVFFLCSPPAVGKLEPVSWQMQRKVSNKEV